MKDKTQEDIDDFGDNSNEPAPNLVGNNLNKQYLKVTPLRKHMSEIFHSINKFSHTCKRCRPDTQEVVNYLKA